MVDILSGDSETVIGDPDAYPVAYALDFDRDLISCCLSFVVYILDRISQEIDYYLLDSERSLAF